MKIQQMWRNQESQRKITRELHLEGERERVRRWGFKLRYWGRLKLLNRACYDERGVEESQSGNAAEDTLGNKEAGEEEKHETVTEKMLEGWQ